MFKLNPIYCCIAAVCSVVTIGNVCATETKTNAGFIVKKDIKHDVSMPLRFIQVKTNPLSSPYTASMKKQVLSELAKESLLIPLSGFQGIGVGLGDYQVTKTRPDIAASVGLLQFVQWVNTDIAVFDKATGDVASGFPKPGNSLWAGFGGPCETQNAGSPTVKYDQLARRWVLSQHAYQSVTMGPWYQCLAVSTSEDATGSYHRYAFPIDTFAEFTRLGLWTDAYYISFTTVTGQELCALERDKMLTGLPASMQCKSIPRAEANRVLPTDLVGLQLPPSNLPEVFGGLAPPSNLIAYLFHVDFSNPANTNISTLTFPVSPYVQACQDTFGHSCAIQPNTSNRLDVWSDTLMSKLVYRQYRDYGSFVLNHTVQGPAPELAPAIRWYEIRRGVDDQVPVLYQSSTLAPDSKNRFLGSIAIDRFTNVAIGYNVTSSLIFPSLELAYHNYADNLNVMTIQPLVTGLGSQVDGISDWGRQSSMSVDPVDECTFWYTNEYLKTTGSFNWSTFIIKFKLAACT